MSHRSVEGGCPEFLHTQAMHRRDFLRVGGLSALGLSLPGLLASQARGSNYGGERPKARAKSCILLFLSGGPSHLETFDPKPDAPTDFRTIFQTIPTNVPGTNLSEFLPDLAKQADKFALVRSMWHKSGGHFGGHRYALTGHVAPGNPDAAARPDDHPGIQSLAVKHLRHTASMPPGIMLPWVATDQGSGASGGMSAGTLGRQFDPVKVEVDTKSMEKPGSVPVFRVPEFALQPDISPERVASRRGLVGMIETQRQHLAEKAAVQDMDGCYQKAYDLLTSPEIKGCFELEKEDGKLRDRYGRNAFGQSCLLARRLVEGGGRFIQVNFSRTVTQQSYGWDTHDKGGEALKTQLIPKLNAGLATLLADLHDRGLLKETLVVAMGEFGRTPKVKKDGGRDHWPGCYSILLAGGGVRGGLVHGKSDRTGGQPANDPVEPRDILCTIMTLLGNPTFVTDSLGRAAPLFEGSGPVEKLYS